MRSIVPTVMPSRVPPSPRPPKRICRVGRSAVSCVLVSWVQILLSFPIPSPSDRQTHSPRPGRTRAPARGQEQEQAESGGRNRTFIISSAKSTLLGTRPGGDPRHRGENDQGQDNSIMEGGRCFLGRSQTCNLEVSVFPRPPCPPTPRADIQAATESKRVKEGALITQLLLLKSSLKVSYLKIFLQAAGEIDAPVLTPDSVSRMLLRSTHLT